MENNLELLPLTDDYIFKRVFAYKGNESVLKDFLEALLKIEIKGIKITNPEIIPYEKGEKRGLLDIKAEKLRRNSTLHSRLRATTKPRWLKRLKSTVSDVRQLMRQLSRLFRPENTSKNVKKRFIRRFLAERFQNSLSHSLPTLWITNSQPAWRASWTKLPTKN